MKYGPTLFEGAEVLASAKAQYLKSFDLDCFCCCVNNEESIPMPSMKLETTNWIDYYQTLNGTK